MIIGLIGQKGSGKTTLATYMEKHFDYKRLSFATPIKKMTEALFLYQGCPTKERTNLIYVDKEKPTKYLNDHTNRYFQQIIGTECFRHFFGTDFWVKVLDNRISPYFLPNTKIVIDDVRFSDEADYIRQKGGKLFRIVRLTSDTTDMHTSEQEMKLIKEDYVITNDNSPQDMYDKFTFGLSRLEKFD